jgi:predicted permease
MNFRRRWFSHRKWESDLSEEVYQHLEMQTAANIAAGMNPEEAKRAARLQFGAVEGVKEDCREERGGLWLDVLAADIRYGIRLLWRSPGFAAVAVLTLTLGIGANTATFSVVQGVLLSRLPYSDPERLVMVWENNPRFPRVWVSYPNFLDWQQSAKTFQQIAAFREEGVNLTFPGAVEHVKCKEVSSNFFSTLGTQLKLGRTFSPEEDRQGGTAVAILGDSTWRNRFGSSAKVLGQSVTLDGTAYTIVGVAPPGFRIEGDADVYRPLGQGDPQDLNLRGSHNGIFCVARLRTGATLAGSQAEMDTIQSELDRLYPDDNRDLGIYVEPLKQAIVGDVGGMLLLLLGAVGFVLLIACANVGNLLLSRSTARTREFAIRAALGASRARLVRQLLTESLLLSLAGAALGFVIAVFGVRWMLAALPNVLPRTEDVAVNASVLLFTLGVSMGVGILFGLAPAFKSGNADLQGSLKEGGRSSTRASHRTQSSLVVVQMALTLVLLVSAGLLLRSIRHLSQLNPGFDMQHLVTFQVGVSKELMNTPESARTAYRQLIWRVRQIPGVEGADYTSVVPLDEAGWIMPFWIGSKKPDSIQGAPRLVGFLTDPGYLRTMKIPLIRGRFFTDEDNVKSPCVSVIDTELARAYFPDSNPLDHTLSAGLSPIGPCRIVGVVGHVSQWGMHESGIAPRNQAYFSIYQDPDQWVLLNFPDMKVVVRTPLDLEALVPLIKGAVSEIGGDQPVFEVKTMEEIAANSMSSQRFPMILLGTFACVALLLASVGIYGVISYSVAQRVNEIGIRMALGAEPGSVFRMVIRQGLGLAAAGIGIGVVAALALTRFLSAFFDLLVGMGPGDPLTFALVASILTGVALLACYIPARRATSVDPMVALRYE